MKVITTEKIPIKMWLDDIEGQALQQARNLANLPFAFRWVALMPDSHPGFGMPIGGVLATRQVVIPNAVGVDIGCGMAAVRTDFPAAELGREKISRILAEIKKQVNRQLPTYAQLARVNEHREPFTKTATHKIKRYLYTSTT